MTSCDKYQAGIVALLDNEAGDEDLQSAAGHLRDCAECREFCRELIGIRRALASSFLPSPSLATRQAVLAEIRDDQSGHGKSRAKDGARLLQVGTLMRWASVLVIGLLSITCFTLGRTAKDLRARLGAAEQQVTAVQEQAKLAESQERQQKAISALYFRMAELEERVNRSSRSESASLAPQVRDRRERQNDL